MWILGGGRTSTHHPHMSLFFSSLFFFVVDIFIVLKDIIEILHIVDMMCQI